MLGAAAARGARSWSLVGRDLASKPDGGDQPRRRSACSSSSRTTTGAPGRTRSTSAALLGGFTIVASALCIVALIVARIRRHVVAAALRVGIVWAVWGLDVYIVKASPHWGQHEVIEAYYRRCARSPEEPLVAYQMNWKGENFYTGNHIPAFVSTGATFTTWLKAQQEKGIKTFWFVTEHSRTSALKNEAGNPKVFEPVTDKRSTTSSAWSKPSSEPRCGEA